MKIHRTWHLFKQLLCSHQEQIQHREENRNHKPSGLTLASSSVKEDQLCQHRLTDSAASALLSDTSKAPALSATCLAAFLMCICSCFKDLLPPCFHQRFHVKMGSKLQPLILTETAGLSLLLTFWYLPVSAFRQKTCPTEHPNKI